MCFIFYVLRTPCGHVRLSVIFLSNSLSRFRWADVLRPQGRGPLWVGLELAGGRLSQFKIYRIKISIIAQDPITLFQEVCWTMGVL